MDFDASPVKALASAMVRIRTMEQDTERPLRALVHLQSMWRLLDSRVGWRERAGQPAEQDVADRLQRRFLSVFLTAFYGVADAGRCMRNVRPLGSSLADRPRIGAPAAASLPTGPPPSLH